MKNNKFSKALKAHDRLYYNALFNYCRDYFNISDDVIIQLRFKKPTIEYFGSINLNQDENVIKIVNFKDFDINGGNIIHEFTHIKQKLNHEIHIEKVNRRYIIFWQGEPYISHSKYMKATREEYDNFPWEVEAYENMKLLSDFHQSIYLRELEGKNPTLDYMFDNNLF